MRRAVHWLSPASLAGRTVLTLLAGLLAFHLGSVWLLERGVEGALEDAREAHTADHAATAARVLDAMPAEVREAAARGLSSPGFTVAWATSPSPGWRDGAALAPLRARLQRQLPDPAGLRLGLAPAAAGDVSRVRGGIRLADGTWVTFEAPMPDLAYVPSHASLASLSAMALGIVLVSVLVVRWITNPLRRLAKAAEDFGRGVAPVPIPEDGPQEVREAAHAFNAMQARIHRLVVDRTQALAAVSHDLRTPIQRLRLRAGFLEDAEAQRAIDADLDEMEGMVESTLAYLRGETESEEPRRADLAAILRTLCDDAADRGSAATYAGPDRAPLPLRPLAVKRAFANLIDNAVKYGGAARVTLSDLSGDATVRIEDDGPGIPAPELGAVFEPFHRLEASRNRGTGGSGLGLTIARQVIAAHGGTVSLANRPGGGLTVTVRLPPTSASAGVATTEAETGSPA
ncbi:ATP-binding protein [Siccirubricoccus phaeus]|uniref:ATP-binding protein n=1 Tax=Siccirubricoccus phaeus TaxID=2595053 RepID=UPI0011F2AE1A|nr:ATP-binding protein [Siccirubricoccus phaeus]